MSCCWSDIDVFDDAVHEVNEKSPVVHFPRDVVVSDAARFVDDKRQVEEAVWRLNTIKELTECNVMYRVSVKIQADVFTR